MKNNKLHILIILFSHTIGGAEKRYTNLFKHLGEHGDNHYTLLMNAVLHDLLQDSGFGLEKYPNIKVVGGHWPRRINDLITKFQAIRVIKKSKPDIIHGILKGLPILASSALRKYKKVASFVHPEIEIPAYQIEALNLADHLDVLGLTMKDHLLAAGVSHSSQMTVAPCSFTDYSRTYTQPKKQIVVFLARLEPMKHPDVFINMLNFIPKAIRQKTKFIMLGKGSLSSEMQKLAEPFIAEGCLEMKGYTADPLKILSESLIFVQTTDCESHGTQSLLEAMACGNAIITTDLPGIETLVDDACGFRVKLTPEAFAEKIVYCLTNLKLAEEMGVNSRTRAIQNQTVEQYAKHIDAVYQLVSNN